MSIIGEGSYGCVHKPSLKCQTSDTVNYDNKVSKLLNNKNADTELKEYSILKDIDPKKKYYLGIPIKCIVKKSDKNINNIKKCNRSDYFLNNVNDMRLLVMKDGGSNISDVLNNLSKKTNDEKIKTIDMLLVYLLNVFSAIKLFVEKKVTHRDIKSENIVFDVNTNTINIIDFGIMGKFSELITKAKNNKYTFDVVHWSLAAYSLFINNKVYNDIQKIDANRSWFNNFTKSVNFTDGKQMKFFYNRISMNKLLSVSDLKILSNHQLYETIKNIKTTSHEDYLNKVFSFLDVHNLGITLLHIIGFAKPFYNDSILIKQCRDLGVEMINLNIFKHITINEALQKYKNILNNSNILNKYNLKIVNNEIALNKKSTVIQNISRPKKSNIKSILKLLETNIIKIDKEEKEKKKVHFISPERSKKISKKNITSPIKKVENTKTKKNPPPGKMINPNTGRFINIPKNKTRKSPPPGKMINPKTGRFIKIPENKTKTENLQKLLKILKNVKRCPPGKILNPSTNRCIKINEKTQKNKKNVRINKTEKKCPPGKILNKKTNRCVEKYKKRIIYNK